MFAWAFSFMNDQQLLRYSRHILLPELGIEAQAHWLSAHVLVVGAGGLGCAAALYLGASGIGHLTVIDHDTVDLTNLQRQVAHTAARVGQLKVQSLTQAIHAINPEVEITALAQRVSAGAELDQYVAKADVVVDCSDNFITRHAINSACVKLQKPLVSGAAVAWDGQLSVHLPTGWPGTSGQDNPCYACLFPPESQVIETPCATMGVLAPLVGTIGSMQAIETLKLLAPTGTSASGRLLMFNAHRLEWTSLNVRRDPHCPTCGS
jgi:molybdopterin/thiamine biosynthesis adenylyltransferase